MTGPGAGADNDLVHAPDPGYAQAREVGAGDLRRVADAGTAGAHRPSPDAPASGDGDRQAPGGNGLLGRVVAAAVAGIVAAGAAVLLARNGVRTNTFPPFLPGASSTTITRYSGPWLTAAAGAALVAALLLLWAVVDLRRWARGRRGQDADGVDEHTGSPHPNVTGLTSS